MPTLLELLGAEPDTPLHGQSRAPLLGGNDTRLEDDVVVSWNEHPDHLEAVARAPAQEWQTDVAGTRERYLAAMTEPVRTLITPDGWRFSTSPELGEPELFHLREDPLERHNLAKDPAQQSRMGELTRRLEKWQKRAGDTAPLSV